ncbi:MAG TPA: hypothetical protein VM686_41765 [Polyangiaceae bacterium]|nr:hypothetical protein [Polyangiaceae bacterium]
MKTKNRKGTRLLSTLVAGLALLAVAERAEAQEIQLTGPLAGAPAVRKLRLYREGRFEFAPAVTFSLLDEYQRTIFLGARLNYNFTDWLAFGAWGAYGGLIQLSTHLTDEIQDVNEGRQGLPVTDLNRRLTAVNMGPNFEDQLGSLDWVVAPQVTVVPFRGKLALFSSIYVDTDLYFFGGPAIVGVTERADCEGNCASSFDTASRVAIAPTGGLGLTFYINKWSGIGFEGRVMPMSYNTGGFDAAGAGKDEAFPDNNISDVDRRFQLNPTLTLSWNIYLPTKYRVSE